MSTSYIDEQRDRLETLLQDLSVRRQLLEANLPPLKSASPLGAPGPVPAPSNFLPLDVERTGPSSSNSGNRP
jgi:hypothetical protein